MPQKQGYSLDTDVDRTRLVDQAQTIDRASERYMREAGIVPGMRVLDLGSGMGDVALLAGRLVGPTGLSSASSARPRCSPPRGSGSTTSACATSSSSRATSRSCPSSAGARSTRSWAGSS